MGPRRSKWNARREEGCKSGVAIESEEPVSASAACQQDVTHRQMCASGSDRHGKATYEGPKEYAESA